MEVTVTNILSVRFVFVAMGGYLLSGQFYVLASSGCKNLLIREEDLLARIEEQLGASDEAACEQIEKILVYPDGRFEIETK